MKHSVRNWHTWLSVSLGLPLLLVGLTTFFIAHGKALDTRSIILPFDYGEAEKLEIRASLQVGDQQWIGTRQGVYRLQGDQAIRQEGAPEDEIRDMLQAGSAILFAGKKALWRYQDGQSNQVHRAECWQLSASGEHYSATCKDQALLRSNDGVNWQALALKLPPSREAKTGTPLSRVIMDIHTGKLFFGKSAEWLWIDFLGFACVGLGLTGLTMWMRKRKRQAIPAAA